MGRSKAKRSVPEARAFYVGGGRSVTLCCRWVSHHGEPFDPAAHWATNPVTAHCPLCGCVVACEAVAADGVLGGHLAGLGRQQPGGPAGAAITKEAIRLAEGEVPPTGRDVTQREAMRTLLRVLTPGAWSESVRAWRGQPRCTLTARWPGGDRVAMHFGTAGHFSSGRVVGCEGWGPTRHGISTLLRAFAVCNFIMVGGTRRKVWSTEVGAALRDGCRVVPLGEKPRSMLAVVHRDPVARLALADWLEEFVL